MQEELQTSVLSHCCCFLAGYFALPGLKFQAQLSDSRASENFWGCLPQSPPKNLGQIPAALVISGIFERFSPGQNGSEVKRQITLNSLAGHPTSEPFRPGENCSKMPEIARACRDLAQIFWWRLRQAPPKIFARPIV